MTGLDGICFGLVFDKNVHSLAQAGLQLIMMFKLAFNLKRSSWLSLLNMTAGIVYDSRDNLLKASSGVCDNGKNGLRVALWQLTGRWRWRC